MSEGDTSTLEAILRAETLDNEDPSALALYEHLRRGTDDQRVDTIVWQLIAYAQERCGGPVCVGRRARATIASYPSLRGASAPEQFLRRLLAASAADLYGWISADLQEHPRRRDEIAPALLAHGWIETEIDAAQIAVALPSDYFEQRPSISEQERDAVVRGYALEQAMVL